jgi:hypothetical protein
MSEWIKCSERMPGRDEGNVFLTWNGQYIGKEFYTVGRFHCIKPEAITHWQPLPSPPQD